MSTAEMLARTGGFEQRADQSWTSHQVILPDMINSVAGDALEMQRRNLFSKDIKGKVNIFKNTSKTFNARCQKFNMKFKASKFRVDRKWKIEK